ncbi:MULTISPECIES: sensor domain-containing diguanylate cyclase [Pseudomonas]|uniref:GGDEF domain-containing protein n=1 Tax=Pseudomonas mosselii TaxID=78327 RepID=A0A5R8Z128_9PSED|nr:GGDEF and EAL domain-containing protein [Pseudomonas mosselii]TLP59035.1 GGDEF domain-containing protein [Pseudomonas mosselii]
MQTAPMPLKEKERLAKVVEWCVAQQDQNGELRALVQLAASYFAVPICLVSIVSECQQWFMARTGLDSASTPRDVSFCAHTILQAEPLEVPDALLDPRFADNPLVTGAPAIRYYCGAPLMVEQGIAIGSLCIIDTVPRPPMAAEQRAMLVAFANMAMSILASIRRSNFFDQPTGLFNRLKLECDVQAHFDRGQDMTLLAIDILPAAVLNDITQALGYNFAHDLTLQVKARIAAQLHPGVPLYKISPTRFATIVDEPEQVRPLCIGIVEALQAPVQCHQIPVLLDAGIGVAPLSAASDEREGLEWLRRLVSAADAARRSVGRCALFQADVDAAQRRAFTLLAALVEALQRDDQLSLHLQPRVHLPQGECRSAEALLRWRHPQLGEISPAEFIPLAEKTALMGTLSLWVQRAVLRLLQQTRALGLQISMNVTARDLESPLFMDTLLIEMRSLGIEPSKLQLEFTESALIEQLEEVQQQLQRARLAGIEIAIDDFGTGYSNWDYLSRIPASLVKLDRSLVHRGCMDARDGQLVRSLVALATQLGYRVGAEGIETAAQLEQASAWGCAEVQGYYLGRPMPLEAFQQWFGVTQLAGWVA